MGSGKGMLLLVHEMMVYSALEYGTAAGSTSNAQGIENSFLRVQNRKH
jgi:hypothetical protein